MSSEERFGVKGGALRRFIEDQIYSLPGVENPRGVFTILLTGSRATDTYRADSDVDIDVLCPRVIYRTVQRAAFKIGLVTAPNSFFRSLGWEKDWHRYFGREKSVPHFAIHPIETVERQVRRYEDVPLWVWTNAKVIKDPGGQFQRVIERFTGYPKPILVRKIKYHWLLSAYWEIECYPHHHFAREELLPAATAMLNAVNEIYRVFFLVEGRPFPYAEKLPAFAPKTKLGRELCPILQRVVDLVVGKVERTRNPWSRLEKAFEYIAISSSSTDCRRLEEACAKAMVAAGVPPIWVKADFSNIGELFSGKLGPLP
jgi:hypothetical protein